MPESSSTERLLQLKQRWERDPSSRLFLQLAEEYRRAGRLVEAISTLSKGLEQHPAYLSAQVAMGRCLLEAGDASRSAEWLERAIRQDPTQLVANKLLVETHLARGDAANARERLDIYRLLNDGDSEIAELERRVHRAAAKDHPASASAPAAHLLGTEEEPFALSPPEALPAIDLAPPRRVVPHEGAQPRELEPFGRLFTERAQDDILRAFERSGIFEVEAVEQEVEPSPVAFVAVAESTPPERPGVVVQPTPEEPEPRLPGPLATAPPLERPPLFSPRQAIGAELELAEPVILPETAPEGAVAPRETPHEAEQTSTTLGELYLAQGHLDEAERSFLAVLSKKPEDAAAAAGLEATRRRRRSVDEEFAGSAELATEPPPVPGRLAARKISVLRNYLARLRRGA